MFGVVVLKLNTLEFIKSKRLDIGEIASDREMEKAIGFWKRKYS